MDPEKSLFFPEILESTTTFADLDLTYISHPLIFTPLMGNGIRGFTIYFTNS